MDLTLYHRPDCPFCWKLRIGMEELGLTYEDVETRLGEKHPDVVRLNPKGAVPVLVDRSHDVVIWESAVALEYVNELQNGSLFGETPASRANIRLVAAYSDSVVGTALKDIIFEKRSKPSDEWDNARIDDGIKRWDQMLDRLELWLGDRDFFGIAFSAADCALLARFGLAEAYGAPVTPSHSRLFDWYERGRQRPSYVRTLPSSFPKAV